METSLTEKIGLNLPQTKILVIVWKELLDAFRDKRTIFTAVLLPFIIMPLSLGLPIFFMSPKSNPPHVAVLVQDTKAKKLVDELGGIGVVKLSTLTGNENLTELIVKNMYDLVLVIPNNFSKVLDSGGTAKLLVFFDSSNMRSEMGVEIINGFFSSVSEKIVKERLQKLNLTEQIIKPMRVVRVTVKTVPTGISFIGFLIPYFIGLFSVIAGSHYAVDTTAGEKERRTLETFLTMPVTRAQIVIGKYVSVSILSFLSIVFQIIGLAAGFIFFMTNLTGVGGISKAVEFNLTIPDISLIVFSAVLTGMIGNALLMLTGVFSKSFKEAQQYTGYVTMAIVMILLVFMYLPPATLKYLIYLPFLGPLTVIRNIVFKSLNLERALITLFLNIIYLLLMLSAVIKLFSKENVIFRV